MNNVFILRFYAGFLDDEDSNVVYDKFGIFNSSLEAWTVGFDCCNRYRINPLNHFYRFEIFTVSGDRIDTSLYEDRTIELDNIFKDAVSNGMYPIDAFLKYTDYVSTLYDHRGEFIKSYYHLYGLEHCCAFNQPFNLKVGDIVKFKDPSIDKRLYKIIYHPSIDYITQDDFSLRLYNGIELESIDSSDIKIYMSDDNIVESDLIKVTI